MAAILPTTKFSPELASHFANMAVSQAKATMGDGWKFVTTPVRLAMCDAALLDIVGKWDCEEETAVSVLHDIRCEFGSLLQ